MNIGFIGVGNIASIIIDSVIHLNITENKNIYLFDMDSTKLEKYKKNGLTISSNNLELVEQSDVIFLCVKPQNMADVLNAIAPVAKNKCFVSVAAGITSTYIRSILKTQKSVIRVMPNTPMLLKCGAIAIAESTDAHESDIELVKRVFSYTGEIVTVNEEKIDTVTAVSGSGPAYFYRIVKVMAEYAMQQGLDYNDGVKLAAKTMQGAARMLLETGLSPNELIAQVTSPGGTTLAALAAFDEKNLDIALQFGMEKCEQRARELKK